MGARTPGCLPYPEALVEMFPGVDVNHDNDGWRLRLHCEKCGCMVDAFRTVKPIPPHVIRSKMKRAGWRLGRHNVCPVKHQERKTPMPANDPPALKVVPPLPTPAEASEAARKAKRETLAWLDEAFDVERGTFKAGVTDATIAKETGVSEATVATLREQFYGPLKLPSELEAARGELGRVTKSIEHLKAEVLPGYERQLARVDARITELVQKNGWKL